MNGRCEICREWLDDYALCPNEGEHEADLITAHRVRREQALERWAKAYDELNGAPESDDDR